MSDGKIRIGGAIAVVLALILSACGDGANSTDATATQPAAISPVVPTATPSVAACPVDAGVCGFAREIAGLMSAGRYDAVADLARHDDFTCPEGTPTGAGGPFPLCSGAAPGEHRSGYSVGALQSEGGVVSRAEFIELLRGWVSGERYATAVPGTGPALATVGCPLIAGAAACRERFAIVLTRGDGRFLLRFGIQRDGAGGTPRIAQTMTGVIPLNQALVSGGDDSLPVVFGVEAGVGTRYFVAD